ncbi:thiamine phosphate synthase [Niabella defluvii]|nr:thiamine phosphate synthase [Niabella sp. I65]
MRRSIPEGIYLIIDPSVSRNILLGKLKEVVLEPIAAVQIWDNFKADDNWMELVEEILQLCHAQNIPVLINNRWKVLAQLELDGIHFDDKPDQLTQLRQELNREIIIGITCGNDLSVVNWANDNGLDYVSFCSMFPSSTANSCELVTLTLLKKQDL